MSNLTLGLIIFGGFALFVIVGWLAICWTFASLATSAVTQYVDRK